MREIKFSIAYRSPHTDTPNKWLISEPLTIQEIMFGSDTQVDFTDGSYLRFHEMNSPEDEVVFREFTGLKDKNGKEIWEGDVVAFRNDISPQPYGNYPDPGEERNTLAEIWYDESLACFSIRNATEKNVGEYPVSQVQDEYGELEVIGSIWENPELLKGEK